MAFQLSPGVLVTEKDLTNVVPAVSASIGAFAGLFNWGPCNEIQTVGSEAELVSKFGRPNGLNAPSWFSAANFLAYANNLKVVRASSTLARNAVTSGTAVKIDNESVYEASYSTGAATVGQWAARCVGTLGNSLKVVQLDAPLFVDATYADYAAEFDTAPGTSTAATAAGASKDELHILVIDEDGLFTGTAGTVVEKYAHLSKAADAKSEDGTSIYYKNVINLKSKYVYWMDHPSSQGATLAAVVITGTAGTFTCTATTLAVNDTVTITGTLGGTGTITSYATPTSYKVSAVTGSVGAVTGFTLTTTADVAIVTTAGTPTGLTYTVGTIWGTNLAVGAYRNLVAANQAVVSLSGGLDTTDYTAGDFTTGYSYFADADTVDISLIITGAAQATVTDYCIDMALTRRDCMVFFSPLEADVVNNAGSEAADIVTYRNSRTSSSYAVMDSGAKYQYDKYNDVYRWIPLNGDIAGLCARTDTTNDAWWSPAGYNRGIIKNVVKLAYNPSKTDRDTLYKSGVNPVVTFPGQGTLLFGDKTLLAKPSAFDRINVRRLFIVLEKAVAVAAKFQLFEFNDAFTRAQFKSIVEPFLRDVQGRRGIYDFRVICDDTNNTGEVIDRNEFVADIYIKPARSINFIQLNFVAVRTSVSFTEVAGA